MGVQLSQILHPKEVALDSLKGKKLALDAYNMLYQFLATIRQPDGQPLTGSGGEVTAHLVGLLYRTTSLLVNGIRPVYAFDGKPSPLKVTTLKARAMVKERAHREWEAALAAGDLATAKKKAAQTSRLTESMVTDAKELLDALGVPWVQAASEGEAQAALMAKRGEVWAAASEDYDTLLFGSPRLLRGLAALKTTGRDQGTVRVLSSEDVLKELGLTLDEFIVMCLLIGTDFNEGFPGIGPKKALKLAQQHLGFEATIEKVGGDPAALREVVELFTHPPSAADYTLAWKRPEAERVLRVLVEKHGFEESRVVRVVDKLSTVDLGSEPKPTQLALDDFGGAA
ncbi:MAG: flap endonuclease-1 [Candidatus Thermoplasmatota archaeon]|nr:flap endonuclease-1 [Candidatus Thermoplasmatota archaeon]